MTPPNTARATQTKTPAQATQTAIVPGRTFGGTADAKSTNGCQRTLISGT